MEHWINDAKVLEYDYGSPRLMQAVSAAVRTGALRVGPGFGGRVTGPIILLDKDGRVRGRTTQLATADTKFVQLVKAALH